MKYGAKANVTQELGNFVAEMNLLDQLPTFHLIKVPLPASHSPATANVLLTTLRSWKQPYFKDRPFLHLA